MSRNMIDGLWKDESGSTAFDYGMIAAVLSIVVVTAISANGKLAIVAGRAGDRGDRQDLHRLNQVRPLDAPPPAISDVRIVGGERRTS